MKNPKVTFRDLIQRDEIAIASGAHDPLSARIVELVDYADLVYMTGWGTSLASTGMPDAGLWTMTEMTNIMSNVTDVVSIPVFADADDGFGDALDVTRTVKKCIKAGLAGIHIEDEVTPKPLVTGRKVLPVDVATRKIRAAVDTRDQVDEDFVIIARSMAHYPNQFGGVDMEDPVGEAISRARSYHEAGADVVNLTMDSKQKYKRVSDEIGELPILATGAFSQHGPETFESLDVDVIMYAATSIWATILANFNYQQQLSEDPAKATRSLRENLDDLPINLEEITGMQEYLALAQEYLPHQLAKVEDISEI